MKHALTVFATELNYQKDIFALAVAAQVIAGTTTAFLTTEWLWAILGSGQLAYIIGAISIGSRMESEKRERTGRLLPLQPSACGLIHFLVFVTYHLVITVVVLLGVLISGMAWLALTDLFTLFGFNLLITVLIFINDDIFYIWGWGARIMLWVAVLLVGLMFLTTTGRFGFSISPGQPKTFVDAMVFNVAWIILVGLDVWIYTRRKSYLN